MCCYLSKNDIINKIQKLYWEFLIRSELKNCHEKANRIWFHFSKFKKGVFGKNLH